MEDCSKCGGSPLCFGVDPGAQKASETAEEIKQQLVKLPSKLQQSKNKAGSHWKHKEGFSNLFSSWFCFIIGSFL